MPTDSIFLNVVDNLEKKTVRRIVEKYKITKQFLKKAVMDQILVELEAEIQAFCQCVRLLMLM